MREVSKLRAINRRRVFAGVAIVSVFLAGLAGALYAGAAGAAGPTDTEPPPQTTTPSPAPDPAPPPPPKPAPKPTPKPAHKPVSHPATVSHAPVTPAPSPTYTASQVTPRATPKVVHPKKHKRHRRARQVAPSPKPQAQVKPESVVKINGVPTAAVTTNASDAVQRSLIITGMGLAALLFLLVFAVPATGARFTPPGRVLMDHQTDLVLAGVAILALTALLFAVTS